MVVLSPSSTLVNVAEDAELRLVRLLADAAPTHLLSASFVQDCEACIVNANASKLISTMVGDAGAMAALFVLEPVDEAVSAFSLLTALLSRVGVPNEEKGLTQALADAVVNVRLEGKEPSELVTRQISLLAVLYNMRPDGKEKCSVLARMIQLAGTHQPEILAPGSSLGDLLHEDIGLQSDVSISPSKPRLVTILDSWEVAAGDRRELYRTAAQGMVNDASRKQRFLLLLVDSYKDAKQVDQQAISFATEAAVGAIRDPVSLFGNQRSMLSAPAIQALAKNKSTAVLHGLLKVFQVGKLDDYNAFLASNGGEAAVLAPWGLSAEECTRYMRILSLCSLTSEHEEIPYSIVSKTLLLPSENEVESWVIAAVSSGLLSAKMDQLQEKVMVERCVVRQFDVDQWKSLQARLRLWKKNVGGVIEGLKQSQGVQQ